LIDGQRAASVEDDTVCSIAASVNGEAAKRYGTGSGIDGDAVSARDCYTGEVAGIDDAYSLIDGDRAVTRATKNDDLAAWCSLRESVGKCPARRGFCCKTLRVSIAGLVLSSGGLLVALPVVASPDAINA